MNPDICPYVTTVVSVTGTSATSVFRCPTLANNSRSLPVFFTVNSTVSLLEETNFLRKKLTIANSRPESNVNGIFNVTYVEVMRTPMSFSGCATKDFTARDFANGFGGAPITAFMRCDPLREGAFLSLTNPFANSFVRDWKRTGALVASFYPQITQCPESPFPVYETEDAVLGFTNLSSANYPEVDLNTGERKAFISAVRTYLADAVSRKNHTIKVNVAWDENDYQIDVGTSTGRQEYERIFSRNHDFGVTHIVYEPRNTLHASRFNATDGWGWEASLWFGMGEQIREGSWDPRFDNVPTDILNMVDLAKKKYGIGLLAYVYPCLAFEALAGTKAMADKLDGYNPIDLGVPAAQNYLIDIFVAFMEKTGAQGFAWDHDIFTSAPDHGTGPYAQWRGWMRILKTLRDLYPNMVMDHRQTAHKWGPWYHLAGSYSEPIAGDENPETYGVPIASLHADHVAADNMRIVNRKYATEQLLPPSRIPGFIFHQTERSSDNGTGACFGNVKECWDMNTRDFDLLGYKYSLLSTIGTAGLNNVVTMIPARDEEEFTLFPDNDINFIRSWLAWTDENIDALQNTMPIASLPPPSIGNVDGTAAWTDTNDKGFLFLFNPNPLAMSVSLQMNEDIGVNNASIGASWIVDQLYPWAQAPQWTWAHDEANELKVGGSDVLVLRMIKAALNETRDKPSAVTRSNAPLVTRSAPIGAIPPHNNTGGSYKTSFIVSEAMKKQITSREVDYPIQWNFPTDYNASWLVPIRLLAYVFIAKPHSSMNVSLVVDGNSLPIVKAYNSRGRTPPSEGCFLGFYADFTKFLKDPPGTSHVLHVSVPSGLPQGAFQGVFYENLETQY
eukprot:g3307.t1